jgi:hypothetical protein
MTRLMSVVGAISKSTRRALDADEVGQSATPSMRGNGQRAANLHVTPIFVDLNNLRGTTIRLDDTNK